MKDPQRSALLRTELAAAKQEREQLKLAVDQARAAYTEQASPKPKRDANNEIVGWTSRGIGPDSQVAFDLEVAYKEYQASVARVEALRAELRLVEAPSAADLDEMEEELRDLAAQDRMLLDAFLSAFFALRRVCQKYNAHHTRKAKLSQQIHKHGRSSRGYHGWMRKMDRTLLQWLFAPTDEAAIAKRLTNIATGVPGAETAPFPHSFSPGYQEFERGLD